MNVCIDQGNTATKIGIFEDKILREVQAFSKDNHAQALDYLESVIHKDSSIILSSVADVDLDINFLKPKYLIKFSHLTSIPIINQYKTPETLGKDRLANAVAAWSMSKGKNSLVIDCGTCIKYDVVDAKGNYFGGAISPGLHMRYRSLHDYTGKLPMIESTTNTITTGTNTTESIQAGVENGILDEINGFINRYTQQYSDLTIFMTGGDLPHFEKAFKNSIFAIPELTLTGLNEILRYHAEKN
ncbi:MAG: type III pantothenate kinase [Crocinitomicaceae bacterium]|jgi:type III pantothenate kinase|nr:type III pantothenate kinase [Crocinitomicaceae bacterium]MBK8927967.1 type III pantothenate kinase [Crocinitomicaceae bacterium]